LFQKPLSQKTLRIFSGIQPTGALHLGNYFGAIRQWIEYQNNPSVELSIYSIVDLHSLTTIQNKQLLNQNIKQMIASLLGCGLDPNKSIIYQQSVIPFHGQLSWILATVVTMAQLSRFPQFKVFL
jgi:tryptophanyl-tRNA synthetase